MGKVGRAVLAIGAFVALLPGRSPAAPAEPRPLPVNRTQKLQDEGAVFTVEGRVTIPKGIELSVFQNIEIRGVGDGPAVIEVLGGFDAVGTLGKEVVFQNVTVEPGETFEGIRLVTTSFRGGASLRVPEGRSADGKIRVETTDFMRPGVVDLAFRGGWVDLATSCFEGPVTVRGVDPEPGRKNRVRVSLRRCTQDSSYRCRGHLGRQGFRSGVLVENADEVEVATCRVSGTSLAIRGWRKGLSLTGNKVSTAKVDLWNPEPGFMAKVQCQNNDFYGAEIAVFAPPKEGLRDAVLMDRCWFRGLEDPKAILLKVIRAGDSLPASNGARVVLQKVSARPCQFAGPSE